MLQAVATALGSALAAAELVAAIVFTLIALQGVIGVILEQIKKLGGGR